jgi:hypothetical protein
MSFKSEPRLPRMTVDYALHLERGRKWIPGERSRDAGGREAR